MGEQGRKKEPFSGRQQPNYVPSGHGTYNCRWRKEERRKAAVARQKALCQANTDDHTQGLVKRIRHDDTGSYIQVKMPMDWRMMLPASDQERSDG